MVRVWYEPPPFGPATDLNRNAYGWHGGNSLPPRMMERIMKMPQGLALAVPTFVICVLSPCLFYGCWALSLLKNSPSKSAKIVIEDDMENDILSDANSTRQQHGCFCCGNFDGSRRPLYNNGPSTTSAPGYIVMEDFVLV